jgi:hypothetical protein
MGVKNAGHLLMLENWQEFNNAIILACGEGHKLPKHSPKPHTFDDDVNNDPSTFFRRTRWERNTKEDTKDASPSVA